LKDNQRSSFWPWLPLISEKEIPILTEASLGEIIEECKKEDSFSKLIRTIGEVFSRPESLSRSFIKVQPDSPIDIMLEKAGKKDLTNLKKEDVRELEGDLDKDEDCKEEDEMKEVCYHKSYFIVTV